MVISRWQVKKTKAIGDSGWASFQSTFVSTMAGAALSSFPNITVGNHASGAVSINVCASWGS